MSPNTLIRSAALALALGASGVAPAPAQAQLVHLVVVDVRAVALGYQLGPLIGRAVQNQKGESVGKIDDFIIGKDRILFAILSVGGFLGLGEHKVVAPFTNLQIAADKIIWPGATKQAVKALPEFHYR